MPGHGVGTSSQPAQFTDSPCGRRIQGHEPETGRSEDPRQPRVSSPTSPYLCHDTGRYMQLLPPVDRSLTEGTLRALAARQGTTVDEETAEQPGKFLHEVRRTEVCHDSEGFHLPPVYYGTIDATPLWINLLHDTWRAGMPDTRVAALLDNLEAALRWLGDYGDSDGDGFWSTSTPRATA
jgi:hypothetical protein